MTSYKPSPAFRMAIARKSKYRLEIESIALLLLKGKRESAFNYMGGIAEYLPFRVWENVIWAGVLRWCLYRDRAYINSAFPT
jgi:hypothetical protein